MNKIITIPSIMNIIYFKLMSNLLFLYFSKKIKERKWAKREKEKSPFEKRKNVIGIPTIHLSKNPLTGGGNFFPPHHQKIFKWCFLSLDFSNTRSIASEYFLSSCIIK